MKGRKCRRKVKGRRGEMWESTGKEREKVGKGTRKERER